MAIWRDTSVKSYALGSVGDKISATKIINYLNSKLNMYPITWYYNNDRSQSIPQFTVGQQAETKYSCANPELFYSTSVFDTVKLEELTGGSTTPSRITVSTLTTLCINTFALRCGIRYVQYNWVANFYTSQKVGTLIKGTFKVRWRWRIIATSTQSDTQYGYASFKFGANRPRISIDFNNDTSDASTYRYFYHRCYTSPQPSTFTQTINVNPNSFFKIGDKIKLTDLQQFFDAVISSFNDIVTNQRVYINHSFAHTVVAKSIGPFD